MSCPMSIKKSYESSDWSGVLERLCVIYIDAQPRALKQLKDISNHPFHHTAHQ